MPRLLSRHLCYNLSMILSDKDIKTKLDNGEIKLSPMPDLEVALGTVSIDLRLGHQFMVYRTTARPYIDVNDPTSFENVTELVSKENHEPFVVHPGEFVLGSTLELVEVPNSLAGRLEGKSSLGRLGIVIHSTAGKVDPGFKGRITLEISNIGTLPIMLYPEMRICQLLFEELRSEPTKSYSDRADAKYKGQTAPVSSMISAEIKKNES